MLTNITPRELQVLRELPPRAHKCGWFQHKDKLIGELTTSYTYVYRCETCGRISTGEQGSGCDY